MNIDYQQYYAPDLVPLFFMDALDHIGLHGDAGVRELAERLGISRSYAYQILAGDAKNVGYGIQVMLKRLLAPGGLDAIDAVHHYDPEKAPVLVREARQKWGTQQHVAQRIGVSRDYLRKLEKSHRVMGFGVQVMLEAILE